MRLSWANQAPPGISFDPEQEVLTILERLAVEAGFEVKSPGPPADHDQPVADMVIKTGAGLLLFDVRRKSSNVRARIDIETRPTQTYRTRHLLLQLREDGEWELRNDSDLREGNPPEDPEQLRSLVNRLFAA